MLVRGGREGGYAEGRSSGSCREEGGLARWRRGPLAGTQAGVFHELIMQRRETCELGFPSRVERRDLVMGSVEVLQESDVLWKVGVGDDGQQVSGMANEVYALARTRRGLLFRL